MPEINAPIKRAQGWSLLGQLRQDFLNFALVEEGFDAVDLEVGSDGWLQELLESRLEISDLRDANGFRRATPLLVGKLKRDSSGTYIVDRDTPINQFVLALREIQNIQDDLKLDLLGIDDESKQEEFLDQNLSRTTKRQIVDVINEAVGSISRNNSQRELLDATDIGSRTTVRSFLSYDMFHWRNYLLAQIRQSKSQRAFNYFKPDGIKLYAPTLADKFLIELFKKIKVNQTSTKKDAYLSQLEDFFGNGYKTYIAIARHFYANDMDKAYMNLASIAKMVGLNFTNNWRKFQGTTTQFKTIQQSLKNNLKEMGTVAGYIEFADKHFKGNMQKCFSNVSAVSRMTGLAFPEDWQKFQGTTNEFKTIQEVLSNREKFEGLEGYIKFADQYCDQELMKAFTNVSAVAKMTGQEMPKGWQGFQGTSAELRAIQEALDNPHKYNGIEGYIRFADEFCDGEMKRAFQNASAVANMSSLEMPQGWQAFRGTSHQLAVLNDEVGVKTPEELVTVFGQMSSTTETTNFRAVCEMRGISLIDHRLAKKDSMSL